MDDDMFWVMLSDYPDSNDDVVEPPGCQINKFSEAEFYRERIRRTEQLHRDQREKLLNSFAEERRSHRLEFFRMIDHDYLADVREGINPLRTMDLCPSVSMILYGSNKSDNGSMENVQEVEGGLNNAIARLLISGEDRARLTIQDILVQYRAEQEFIRERQLAKLKDLKKYQSQVMNNLRSHIKDDIPVPAPSNANANTPEVAEFWNAFVSHLQPGTSQQQAATLLSIIAAMANQQPFNGANNQQPFGANNQQSNNKQPFNGANNQQPFSGVNNQQPLSGANNQKPFSDVNNQKPFNGVNNQKPFSGVNNRQPFNGGVGGNG
ncbi:15799_t:CDS:2 [Dentiscutata erythropus]|uniref:15799_t:CDS:1 n=1 Tax=Dentiscutata erythropus TaxID=1348616 RepID=A0A9N9HGB9_9GLOM|nr:15799_t:CDS:2 [Dentiscutata erythropus]